MNISATGDKDCYNSLKLGHVFLSIVALQLIFIPKCQFTTSFDALRDALLICGLIGVWMWIVFDKHRHVHWNYVDAIFGGFVIWNIISISWGNSISLGIANASSWFFLFLVYKVISCCYQHDDLIPYSKKLLSGVLLINTAVIGYVLFTMFLQGNGFGITHQELETINTYIHSNANLSAALLVLLCPIYYLVFQGSNRRQPFYYLVVFIHLGFLFLLQARVALFAGVILLIAATVRHKTSRGMRLYGFIGMLAAFVVALLIFQDKQWFLNHLNPFTSAITASDERLLLWESSWKTWMTSPILGVGSGNWIIEYVQFAQEINFAFDTDKYFRHPHNIWLSQLTELGVVGFLLFAGIFISIGISITRQQSPRRAYRSIALLLLLSYGIMSFFYGIIDSTEERFNSCQVALFVYCGAILAYSSHHRQYRIATWVTTCLLLFFSYAYGVREYRNFQLKQIRLIANQKEFSEAAQRLDNLYSPIFYSFDTKMNSIKSIKTLEAENFLAAGTLDRGIDAIQVAINDQPHYHYNWYLLGRLYLENRQYEKAVAALNKAKQLNHHFLKTSIMLVDAYHGNSESKLARETYKSIRTEIDNYLSKYQTSYPNKEIREKQQFYRRLNRYKKQLDKLNKKMNRK